MDHWRPINIWQRRGLGRGGGGRGKVIEQAEEKDEKLLLRIRGKDLFACECKAKYHRSCKSKYIQRSEYWRSGMQLMLRTVRAWESIESCYILLRGESAAKQKDVHPDRTECNVHCGLRRITIPKPRTEKLKNRLETSEVGKHVSFTQLNTGANRDPRISSTNIHILKRQ